MVALRNEYRDGEDPPIEGIAGEHLCGYLCLTEQQDKPGSNDAMMARMTPTKDIGA